MEKYKEMDKYEAINKNVNGWAFFLTYIYIHLQIKGIYMNVCVYICEQMYTCIYIYIYITACIASTLYTDPAFIVFFYSFCSVNSSL